MKTQVFGEKGYLPSGIFFGFSCRVMEYDKRLGNSLSVCTKKFHKKCRNYYIFSVGLKRSIETVFFNKRATFQVEKRYFGHFLTYCRVWQTTGNELWGFNRTVLEIIRSLLQDLRRCWKHVSFKKCYFSSKEKFRSQLPRNIGYDSSRWTVYESSSGILIFDVEAKRSFLYDLRGCWKQIFWKKGYFSIEGNISAQFFS